MEKKQTVSKHKLLSYPSVSSDKLLKNTFTVSVYIGMTLVVCALACGAAVLALLVARRYYCHRKQKLAGECLYIDSVWGQLLSFACGRSQCKECGV